MKPLIITPAAVLETLDIINEKVTAVASSSIDSVITIVRDSFHEDARTEQGYAFKIYTAAEVATIESTAGVRK